jgi:hypothetical protein
MFGSFCHPSPGWNVSGGGFIPVVSLRSTTGYTLCSLREQSLSGSRPLREAVSPL